jgi:hypothetical protein
VPSPNGYLLQRYLLHADIHLGTRLRLWTELNSSFENGRVGGPQPVIDEDKLDPHQGFVEFEIVQRPGVAVRVRASRQEIEFGSGRMYSLREGPNVPLSFDGVRAIAQAGSWRLDAWVARPVTTTSGIFDDSSHRQFSVWGAYVTRTSRRQTSLDAYYPGQDRRNASFDKVSRSSSVPITADLNWARSVAARSRSSALVKGHVIRNVLHGRLGGGTMPFMRRYSTICSA